MDTEKKIAKLKKKAKKVYLSYMNEYDAFSCGQHLAQHMSMSLTDKAQQFDCLLDELTKLDPSTPTRRLFIGVTNG
jgi:hypothetical protein